MTLRCLETPFSCLTSWQNCGCSLGFFLSSPLFPLLFFTQGRPVLKTPLPASSCSLTPHGGHHAVHHPAAALPAHLLVPPSGLVIFHHIPYIRSSCFVLTNLSPPESRAPSSFPLGSIQCTQEKYVLYRHSAAKNTDKEMDLDSVSTSRLQVYSPPPKHCPSIATGELNYKATLLAVQA